MAGRIVALALGALAAAVVTAAGFAAANTPHGGGHDHRHHKGEAA